MIHLPTNHQTLGVVLCGGKSQRMGSDKGLQLKGEKTWALTMARKLAVMNMPVVYSIREEQYEKYSKIADHHELITDTDVPFEGPLKGIMSVHEKFPGKDLFILACDLVDMDTIILEKLFYAYQHAQEPHDFFHFKVDEKSEPLCGIYTAHGLSKIKKRHDEGQLEKFSMQYVLTQEDTMSVKLNKAYAENFMNYNFPKQINI